MEEYEEDEETAVGGWLPHVGSHADFFVAAAPVSGAGQGGKREGQLIDSIRKHSYINATHFLLPLVQARGRS